MCTLADQNAERQNPNVDATIKNICFNYLYLKKKHNEESTFETKTNGPQAKFTLFVLKIFSLKTPNRK